MVWEGEPGAWPVPGGDTAVAAPVSDRRPISPTSQGRHAIDHLVVRRGLHPSCRLRWARPYSSFRAGAGVEGKCGYAEWAGPAMRPLPRSTDRTYGTYGTYRSYSSHPPSPFPPPRRKTPGAAFKPARNLRPSRGGERCAILPYWAC